ncbi:MAG: DUF6186 family protein [Acidimicrobiales bacterium]
MTWAIGVYGAWVAVVVWALVLWWLTATVRSLGGHRVARAGALIRGLTRRPPLRLVLVVGWMWVGWHLFAR